MCFFNQFSYKCRRKAAEVTHTHTNLNLPSNDSATE